MISDTLRRLANDLRTEAAEPEIDRDALYLTARRLDAQAEMLDQGLDAPRQVAP